MFNVIAAFHVLRVSSPIAVTQQPMLDHREVKGGSNREAETAKDLGLQSLLRAPSLENGNTGVSQIPVTI